MNRMQKLAIAALTALALTAGAVAIAPNAASVAEKGSFDNTEVAKVNEYEGQHRITEVAKVNEYEGQHRVVAWSWGVSNSY